MTNAGDEGVECGADDCGESLAVMKQCTRCRSIFYCSLECQKKHWKSHKSSCSAPSSGNAITSSLQQRGSSMEGSSKSAGRAAPTRRRGVPTACTCCGGTGKVPVEDRNSGCGDGSIPLATLQGGAAGYVVREKMCGECDGDGVIVSAPIDPPQVESPACYVCQAPYGTPCTCDTGDQVYR